MIHMDRLWNRAVRQPRTNLPKGCLEWQGALDPSGYGAIKVNGKKVNTHKLAYELVNGEVPEGQVVCHECDNRKCIEVDHLWLGSRADNNKDMAKKGRAYRFIPKSHCVNDHELTSDNVLVRMCRGYEVRRCRTCQNNSNREYMRRVRTE